MDLKVRIYFSSLFAIAFTILFIPFIEIPYNGIKSCIPYGTDVRCIETVPLTFPSYLKTHPQDFQLDWIILLCYIAILFLYFMVLFTISIFVKNVYKNKKQQFRSVILILGVLCIGVILSMPYFIASLFGFGPLM